MKTETVNVNSWHYRLATTYGPVSTWRLARGEADFCSYLRGVFLGLLLVFFITAMGSILTVGLIGMPMIYVVSSILELGWHFPPAEVGIFLVFDLAIAIFGFFMWFHLSGNFAKTVNAVIIALGKNATEKYVEKEPGFVSLAYRKFKEKTCFRLQSVE